jgi:hypothetical protein
MPENEKKNIKSQPASAVKDLVIIAAITILVFILSYFFDVFIFIVKFLEKYPQNIIYVDEIITVLLTLSIAFAIFSWRRWQELKKETAERIKKQEEIICLNATQAEVERVINKQLRSDREQMKEAMQEILQIFCNKGKREA